MNRLRNHWLVILIVPLVVIATTFPAALRIFDRGEFWLHTAHADYLFKFWDAWHLERTLAGQTAFYFSDSIFHPQGVSLAFHQIAIPHALLLLALQKLMPIDDAYNLLFLLILCFNGFCAYPLIAHLIKDKWIALFGAVAVVVATPFPHGSTIPDLTMIGTLPLTIYFLRRAVLERRWRFAALAGICAGATAFISVYVFAFTVLSALVYAIHLSLARWNQGRFWRQLLLFMGLCALISAFRVYPMAADAIRLEEGINVHAGFSRSNDVMEFFIRSGNPVSGDLLRRLFNVPADAAHESAYLGIINLLFLGCAILHKPFRRALSPWLALMLFFATLRLGHYLAFNGVEYPGIALPERFLSDALPALFGKIDTQEFYQIGVVIPLAALSCYGLAALLRSKPVRLRAAVALACIVMLALEFHAPLTGSILKPERTAYINWLKNEPESAKKLINLPQKKPVWDPVYHLYLQTLTGYPQAFGRINRTPASARAYIDGNLLLRSWGFSQNAHCLPNKERAYLAALEQLLADGFTHVVMHAWRYGEQYIKHSFWSAPVSYDDGLVRIYRLRDLRQSCESLLNAPPRFSRLAASPLAIPGARSSILSFHPSERVDDETFAYLDSLFDDWQSLLHLYQDDGVWVTQSSGTAYADADAFASDNQVIYLLYNTNETDRAQLNSITSLDDFALCQTESYEDGAVIEVYLREGFSCALIDPSGRLRVEYDNGFAFENILVEMDQDRLDVQLLWSRLPSEPHSFSLQVLDAAGHRIAGSDSAFGYNSLIRRRLDIAALPPGSYTVTLIVYNFNTGQSVPGAASETGARFERALEIAAIDRR